MPLRPPPDDAEDKLRDIRSVTDAALSHLDADELLAALLDRVRAILDGDTAAVLLLDSSGRQLVATAASGLEEEVSPGCPDPGWPGFRGPHRRRAAPGHLGPGRSRHWCSTRCCWRRASGRWWACRCWCRGRCWGCCMSARCGTGFSPPTMPRCCSWPPTGRRSPCSRCGRATTVPPRSPCSAAWCRRRCLRWPRWKSPPGTCRGPVMSAVTGTTCSSCPRESWPWWWVMSPAPGLPPRSRGSHPQRPARVRAGVPRPG